MQGCFDWQSSNTPKWDSARRATGQTTSKVVEFQWNCLDIVQFHCSFAEHIHKKKIPRGKIWTYLINCNHMRCKLTFSGQMWLPDIHFLITYQKLHENDCRPELHRLGLLICTLNQSLNLWWKDLIIWDILILSRLYCFNNTYYMFSLASKNNNSVSQKVYGAMLGLYFSSWGLRPF